MIFIIVLLSTASLLFAALANFLAAEHYAIASLASYALQAALSFFMFLSLYRITTAGEMRLSSVFAGAALGAVVWEALKNAFAWYLGAGLASYGLIYGSLLSLIYALLWAYTFSLSAMLGGCAIAAFEER